MENNYGYVSVHMQTHKISYEFSLHCLFTSLADQLSNYYLDIRVCVWSVTLPDSEYKRVGWLVSLDLCNPIKKITVSGARSGKLKNLQTCVRIWSIHFRKQIAFSPALFRGTGEKKNSGRK